MTPTAAEMARRVSRLLLAVERDDQSGIVAELESATADAPTAGMTIVSLAYVASRDLAAMAREQDAELSVGGVYASDGPIDIVDPRHIATLLAVASANADNDRDPATGSAKRDALLATVTMVLDRGKAHSQAVIAVLMGMAVATQQTDQQAGRSATYHTTHQASHQNPEEN